MKTNIRAVGLSQKVPCCQEPLRFFSTVRKKTGNFDDVESAEGAPTTIQLGADGNGERAQECEPPHLTP